MDGVSRGAISSYTFGGVAADHTMGATFALSVPPDFVTPDRATFTTGRAEVFTVTSRGIPSPIMALSGTLPVGVTFTDGGDGTGALSGYPTVGSGGVYRIVFTASNDVLPDAAQAFALTIEDSPQPAGRLPKRRNLIGRILDAVQSLLQDFFRFWSLSCPFVKGP